MYSWALAASGSGALPGGIGFQLAPLGMMGPNRLTSLTRISSIVPDQSRCASGLMVMLSNAESHFTGGLVLKRASTPSR